MRNQIRALTSLGVADLGARGAPRAAQTPHFSIRGRPRFYASLPASGDGQRREGPRVCIYYVFVLCVLSFVCSCFCVSVSCVFVWISSPDRSVGRACPNQLTRNRNTKNDTEGYDNTGANRFYKRRSCLDIATGTNTTQEKAAVRRAVQHKTTPMQRRRRGVIISFGHARVPESLFFQESIMPRHCKRQEKFPSSRRAAQNKPTPTQCRLRGVCSVKGQSCLDIARTPKHTCTRRRGPI